MSKGFDIDSVDIEMSKDDMKKLIKKYKKLKKYQNSSFHAIRKLSGDETIIDKLTKESEDFKNVTHITKLLDYISYEVYNRPVVHPTSVGRK